MLGRDQGKPRWLVIVPRDQRDLYESLRQGLKPDAPFHVILERRQGERRRSSGASPKGERRRANRRQQQPVGSFFVATIVRAEAMTRPSPLGAEPTIVNTACPACSAMLSFELPRFPQPPARLDAEVVHSGGVGGTQHYAEIQAFTVSGRPLLIGRVQTTRRDRPS